MFRGINAVNMDAKGRIAVPSRYRTCLEQEAKGQLIVTIDTDERCLLLYPLPEWEIIEQKIEALPSFNKASRRIQRFLIGHATECELDSNGRILVPELLREYADLKKRVIFVGLRKKIEVWSEHVWKEKRDGWLADDPVGEIPPELNALSL